MSKRLLTRLSIMAAALLFGGASCISLTSSAPGTSGPAGMFVSTDKGDTWQQISLLPQAGGVKNLTDSSVYRLIVDPQDQKAFYWLTRGEGMFFSYNGGKTWQQPAAPFASGFIYSAAVSPIDKCTIYATNGTLVYRSDDCSRSWKETYRESRSDRIVTLAFNPYAPYQIYMAKTSGDFLQSQDFGKSWSVVNRFQTRIDHVEVDPHREGVIYIASHADGLYRSTDGGAHWKLISSELSSFSGGLEYRRLYLHPTNPGTVFWISTYGILVSKDSGDTWAAMDLINPPGSANIYAFAVNPRNDKEMYYTATINNRSTFYRTADGGNNWTTKKLPSAQVPTYLRVDPEQGSVVYIGFTIPPKE